jgi:hypothetical protein
MSRNPSEEITNLRILASALLILTMSSPLWAAQSGSPNETEVVEESGMSSTGNTSMLATQTVVIDDAEELRGAQVFFTI